MRSASSRSPPRSLTLPRNARCSTSRGDQLGRGTPTPQVRCVAAAAGNRDYVGFVRSARWPAHCRHGPAMRLVGALLLVGCTAEVAGVGGRAGDPKSDSSGPSGGGEISTMTLSKYFD